MWMVTQLGYEGMISEPPNIVVAMPIAAVVLQFPTVIIGPIVRMLIGDGNHIKIISAMAMALLVVPKSIPRL